MMTEDDAFERAARKELVDNARLGFRIHLFVYVAVQLLLAATWWFTSSHNQGLPWFIYPLLGWGIGLGAHYMAMRASISRARPPGV